MNDSVAITNVAMTSVAMIRADKGFRARTRNSFYSQGRHAKEKELTLLFSLEEFRAFVARVLADGHCPYCECELDFGNWSPDHMQPTSRGGAWALDNLVICCYKCNETKGPLTHKEYCQLIATTSKWDPSISFQFLARVRHGGKLRRKNRRKR